MGTRADFYVGRGKDAEWLGSIAWDGYPNGIDDALKAATTKEDYLGAVAAFFAERDDVTLPENGWPWPWNDSHTSDYAYAFDGGKVWHSFYLEYPKDYWWPATLPAPDEDDEDTLLIETFEPCVFPDMSAVKNVTLGGRSGLLVIST